MVLQIEEKMAMVNGGCLLVSFDDGYCTGYHCLRKTEAWPA